MARVQKRKYFKNIYLKSFGTYHNFWIEQWMPRDMSDAASFVRNTTFHRHIDVIWGHCQNSLSFWGPLCRLRLLKWVLENLPYRTLLYYRTPWNHLIRPPLRHRIWKLSCIWHIAIGIEDPLYSRKTLRSRYSQSIALLSLLLGSLIAVLIAFLKFCGWFSSSIFSDM